ncbi:MAG: hypothetical protein ACXABF_14905 [Candidatus Thorarchaeota archaeon]|jgi:hypothetical protein
MTSLTVEDDWTDNLNMGKLLNYYLNELLGLIKGNKLVDSVSFGARKRLIEYGILRRFGSKYELTDRGLALLNLTRAK